MRVRLHSFALDDLDDGRRFYDRQLAGLGIRFLDSLFADIEALLPSAGVHQKVFGYHRALSRRFPYAIYYRLNGPDIEVVRVLDCRQHPVRTGKALEK